MIDEQLMMDIISEIDCGVSAVDHKGVFFLYNKQMGILEGMNPKEVLGKSLLDLYIDTTVKNSLTFETMRMGQPLINHRQVYKTIHGKTVCTVISQFPIIRNGKITGVLEIAKGCAASDSEMTGQTATPPFQRSDFYYFKDFKTVNRELIESLDKLRKMVTANPVSNVFIFGETGTGKEILAQSIHSITTGNQKPFIAQNCASVPESLAESIFFGTTKGSFTGAQDRMGLFERADGGTLFLDELNSMPYHLQPKLLRVIEQGKVRRLGALKESSVDVRIIATVNVNPEELIKKNLLREDLFYRLCSIYFTIPPLRERREDIAYLCHHHLSTLESGTGGSISISKEVLDLFESYQWKGNVRELKNVLENAANALNDENVITTNHLSSYFTDRLHLGNHSPLHLGSSDLTYTERIHQVERELISKALTEANGNISLAARMLKIKRQTLQHKINKFMNI